MLKYVFWSFPFLISFATASGELNENFYVKLFLFELIFIIMFVWRTLQGKKVRDFNVSIGVSDILILCLLVVYSYFYIDLYNNIIENSIFLIYLLFYFSSRLWSGEKTVNILIDIVPLVIVFHLLFCALQYFSILPNYNSYFKIGSSFGNPDMLSAYLAVLLPFCYMSDKWKLFRIIVVVLTISLFFFIQARTAIATTALTILLYYVCRMKVSKISILIGTMMLILGIVLLIHWHTISVLGRFYIWIVALSMMVSKPLGWGPYAFEKYYPEYQSKFTIEYPEIANALNYDIVHSPYNEFLNIAVTIGIVGLLFYLLFTIFTLITAYRIKSLLLYPLLAFQFVSLSYFPFRIIPLTAIYIICCSIVIGATNAPFRVCIIYSFSKLKILAFCVLIPVIICFSLGLFSFGYWRKAIEQSSDIETYSKACESFEKSYPFLKNNGRFLISYAELQYRMGNKKKMSLMMYRAEHYFSDIAFLHNLSMLYEEDGKICEAKRIMDLATNMSPCNINITFAQIQLLQRVGDVKQAYLTGKCLLRKIYSRKVILKQQDRYVLKKINEYINKMEENEVKLAEEKWDLNKEHK